jgi:conjugal transfer pilus assembly protein TraU
LAACGSRRVSTSATAAASSRDGRNGGAKWNVHWYVYPLLYWMEILTDFACMEQSSFDIAYVTEIDPLWQDDTLTALINPKSRSSPTRSRRSPAPPTAARRRQAAARSAVLVRRLSRLDVSDGRQYRRACRRGPVEPARALALCLQAPPRGRGLGTMGSKGLCGKYVMPIMRKQQYRFQATIPSPMVKGRWACRRSAPAT